MKKILLFVLILGLFAATVVWIRYGGGSAYPDLTTAPALDSKSLETVLAYAEPIGGVAVDRRGRIFFAVHPESRPRGNKLLEYVDGAAVPYPSGAAQQELFDTVQAIAIDRFDRLWTIDHGNHGLRRPRIIAIDLDSGKVLRDQSLDSDVAPPGSFLQDIEVSFDGRTIAIADASFWRKSPAIIIYDVESGQARRVLENHVSVSAESYLIHSQSQDMAFLGGMIAMRGGVNGLAFSTDWLYFSAISGSGLFRVRLSDLRNAEMPTSQLGARVERYSDKPLSNGLTIDLNGNVYVTDIEHSAIFIIGAGHSPRTLIQSPALRWPNAMSFGPDGYIFVSDSALPELILQNREHIDANGPYRVFRFRPGFAGIPGQ